MIGLLAPVSELYIGRWTADHRCAWPGSAVRVVVDGDLAALDVSSTGDDGWQMFVDGKPVKWERLAGGRKQIGTGLKRGRKTVEWVKRTESFVGVSTVHGVTVLGKRFRVKPRPKLLVYGDSITCAYGNEGKNQDEHYTPATENASASYASLAARALKMDAELIAWSGRTMAPTYTIPEIMDDVLPGVRYEGPRTAARAVVVNLSTNDWGKGAPDRTMWTGAYVTFLRKVRRENPKAAIVLCTGPMMGPEGVTSLRSYLDDITRTFADKRTFRLDFRPQDRATDGLGSDWHPSQKRHNGMARELVGALRSAGIR